MIYYFIGGLIAVVLTKFFGLEIATLIALGLAVIWFLTMRFGGHHS